MGRFCAWAPVARVPIVSVKVAAHKLQRQRMSAPRGYFGLFGFAQSPKAGKFESASLALALNFSNCITFSMRAARNSLVAASSAEVSANQRTRVEP
ncbi:hypothetical protein D3C83_84700 [compost metagenome]